MVRVGLGRERTRIRVEREVEGRRVAEMDTYASTGLALMELPPLVAARQPATPLHTVAVSG
jgi:hypothetical protein